MTAQSNHFSDSRMRVAASSLLLLLSACGKPAAVPPDLAANLAAPYDYYINGMHTIRYTAAGERSYKLSADRVTHFPDDDHAELSNPDVLWYQQESTPWTLTAAAGNLHRTGEEDELTLSGDVQLNTTLAAEGALLVETSRMNVLPALQQASTDAEVTLTTTTTRMQSKGMQLSLPDNHVKLLNNVRGTHAP